MPALLALQAHKLSYRAYPEALNALKGFRCSTQKTKYKVPETNTIQMKWKGTKQEQGRTPNTEMSQAKSYNQITIRSLD